jgi:hypothetical protein
LWQSAGSRRRAAFGFRIVAADQTFDLVGILARVAGLPRENN